MRNPIANRIGWLWRTAASLGFGAIGVLVPDVAHGRVSFYAVATSDSPIATDVASDPVTAVGYFQGRIPSLGFRWTPENGFEVLPDLPGGDVERSRAAAVSGDGRVVVGRGYGTATYGEEAVLWRDEGGAQSLGAPAGRQVFRSEAFDVSESGEVVVGSAVVIGTLAPDQAFRWTAADGMEILGALGPSAGSTPTAVSRDGDVVVGRSTDPVLPGQWAFRWRRETGLFALAAIPPDAYPTGVSDDGRTVVGDTNGHAFRWNDDAGLEGLPALPGCCGGTYARSVSGDGRLIVGSSNNAAVLWQEGQGVRSLVDLLVAGGADRDLWTLQSADAISRDGCVVTGRAYHPSRGFGFYVAEIGCNTCRDGLDDDGDGLVDLDDPGCADSHDLDERDPARECDDGNDNDWDGVHDFRVDGAGDPACGSIWGREASECQDGLDNDNGPGVDFDGGASRFGGEPYDLPDPQCTHAWTRSEAPGRCGIGYELVLLAPLLARLSRARRSPGNALGNTRTARARL